MVVVIIVVIIKNDWFFISYAQESVDSDMKRYILDKLLEKEDIINELNNKIVQQQQDYNEQNKIVKEQKEEIYWLSWYKKVFIFFMIFDIIRFIIILLSK